MSGSGGCFNKHDRQSDRVTDHPPMIFAHSRMVRRYYVKGGPLDARGNYGFSFSADDFFFQFQNETRFFFSPYFAILLTFGVRQSVFCTSAKQTFFEERKKIPWVSNVRPLPSNPQPPKICCGLYLVAYYTQIMTVVILMTEYGTESYGNRLLLNSGAADYHGRVNKH